MKTVGNEKANKKWAAAIPADYTLITPKDSLYVCFLLVLFVFCVFVGGWFFCFLLCFFAMKHLHVFVCLFVFSCYNVRVLFWFINLFTYILFFMK